MPKTQQGECVEQRASHFKNLYETLDSRLSYNRLLVERIVTSVAKFKDIPRDVSNKHEKPHAKEEPGLIAALFEKAYYLSETNEVLEMIANHLDTIV